MNLRTRSRIFYFLVLLFLIMGPAIVLYAYGWRLDFANFRIVRIGGIFLKNLPTGALVKIDNKSAEKQEQKFLSGVLLSNLLPGSYKIEIDKDGYYDWERTLVVKPAIVTQTQPVLLFPKKEPETLVNKPLANFWVNDDTLIYQDVYGRFFLTDPDYPTARTNFGILFNDLKERVLNFPGYVKILDIVPQANSSQWIINSAKASYLIDVKRLTLELMKEKVKVGADQNLLPDLDFLKKISWYQGTKKEIYNEGRLYLLKDNGLSYQEL